MANLINNNVENFIDMDDIAFYKDVTSNTLLYLFIVDNNTGTIINYNKSKFYYNAIKKIIIPSNIDNISYGYIGDGLFINNAIIKYIYIEEGIISIGDYAFSGCNNLSYIKLPDSVFKIGENAFYGCNSLTFVKLPNLLEEMINNPFSDCNNLTHFLFGGYNIFYSIIDEVLFDKTQTKLIIYPNGKKTDTYTIPSSVNTIMNNAFDNSKKLKNIILPDGIIKIGDNAFANCINLTSINLPDSITEIGNGAFNECKSLTNIVLPNNLININKNTFINCEKLTNINIPPGINNIDDSAFNSCTSLNNIIFPNNINNIGNNAFNRCTSLNNIIFPDSLTNISDNAFNNCSGLTNVIFSTNIKKIGISSFGNCTSLTSIIIINNIPYIDDSAFVNIINKITIYYYPTTFNNNIPIVNKTIINANNYYTTSAGSITAYTGPLKYICIPLMIKTSNITSIGINAFINKNITDVIFQLNNGISNIISINSGAFNNCTLLSSINIPASVTNIGLAIDGKNAFYNCTSLTSIIVNENNNKYSNDNNGVLFDKYKYELIQYPLGNLRTSYKIPESVTNIKNYAFYKSILSNIDLPKNLKIINKYAFNICNNLPNIIIPSSVTSIDTGAFLKCGRLGNIVFKGNCPNLLPGNGAFDGINNLNTNVIPIIYHYGWDTTKQNKFNNTANLNTTKIKFNNIKCSLNILPFMTYIDNNEYENCINLTSITIPPSITYIGNNAFNNCSKLINITFNDIDKINIGSNVFYNIGNNNISVYNNLWTNETIDKFMSLTTVPRDYISFNINPPIIQLFTSELYQEVNQPTKSNYNTILIILIILVLLLLFIY